MWLLSSPIFFFPDRNPMRDTAAPLMQHRSVLHILLVMIDIGDVPSGMLSCMAIYMGPRDEAMFFLDIVVERMRSQKIPPPFLMLLRLLRFRSDTL